MRFVFTLFIFINFSCLAQLTTNLDTLDYGTFSVDTPPTKIVELKLYNPTKKKVTIYDLDCSSFLFYPSFKRVADGKPEPFLMPWKAIVIRPKKTLSIFFYPDKHRFHQMDAYDTAEVFKIDYLGDLPSKEIPIVCNVIPNIKWDTNYIDLGKVKQGDTLKAVFRFENKSSNTIRWQYVWQDGNSKDTVLYPPIILPNALDSVVFTINTTYETDSIKKGYTIQPEYNFDEPKLGDDMPYTLLCSYFVDSVKLYSTLDFETRAIHKEIDSIGYVSFIYKFKNNGTAPLIIYASRGSSGSVVPSYTHSPILPNESSEVIVSYDGSHPGPFTKTVTIESNARKNPFEVLKLSGVIR